VFVWKPKCTHYGTTLLLDKDNHKDTFSIYTTQVHAFEDNKLPDIDIRNSW
jgi:hypothetical protein